MVMVISESKQTEIGCGTYLDYFYKYKYKYKCGIEFLINYGYGNGYLYQNKINLIYFSNSISICKSIFLYSELN
jgi:hypothetical protein